MCIFTDELHPCSYARQSTVIGFWKCCFVHVHSKVCWFGSLNALLTLPVEKDCVGKEKPCSRRAETGDIILLNESLRFIQNVASCYVFFLQKSQ